MTRKHHKTGLPGDVPSKYCAAQCGTPVASQQATGRNFAYLMHTN